jgi:hypothetical protein
VDPMTLAVASLAVAAISLIALGIARSSPRPELNKIVEQHRFGRLSRRKS